MKILLTGFEPFGENFINSSQELLDALPDTINEDVHLLKMVLPVEQDLAPEIALHAMDERKPDTVMAFGLAAGRAEISIEHVALNLMDFHEPDNKGFTVSDVPVVTHGPAAYFTSYPTRKMLNKLTTAGIPAALSLSAGTFLCNQVFYSIMHEIAVKQLSIRAGFIHLPSLPEAAALREKPIPSMSLDLMLEAAKIMITCLSEEFSSVYK